MNRNVLLIGASILLVISLTLLVMTIFTSEDIPTPISEQQKEIKETFDNCEDRGDKDWCCKETWSGDRLIERECRAFDYDYVEDLFYDREAVTFGSGSMEPLLHRGDNLYYRELSENELLWLGEIYSYEVEDRTIVHRLVGQLEEDYYIFKGDNNDYIDAPVHRDQIGYELIAICFGGYCD